jgi:hypothetical protein
MAARGRRYVLEEYSWPVVLDRMEADLEHVAHSGAGGGASHGPKEPGLVPSTRVLVVGSYAPIPLPAAEASVAAVRRNWAAGYETTVVSPRLSAADLMVPICGLLGAARLERVRRLTASERAVLVVEKGFPFVPGPVASQLVVAAGLRRALRRFRHVTLVVVGKPLVPARAMAVLRSAADEVRHHPGGGEALGVTPLGPAETTPAERPAQMAVAVARRVLGRHSDPVAARLGRVRREVIRGRGLGLVTRGRPGRRAASRQP